jgi:hypothetical protein
MRETRKEKLHGQNLGNLKAQEDLIASFWMSLHTYVRDFRELKKLLNFLTIKISYLDPNK